MIYAKTDSYLIISGKDESVSDYVDKGFYICHLFLNTLSFGSATNTFVKFHVYYDLNRARWNFQKPELPTYYGTPRSVLTLEPVREEITPAPSMKTGYSSKTMQQYYDPNFPDGFVKLAWDYPCPHIDEETNYVHPGLDRLLTKGEMSALHKDSYEKIAEYIKLHISFYEKGAWGLQDFSAHYDKFMNKWRVDHHVKTPFIKHFNFQQYTPQLCHPVSDRYPTARQHTREKFAEI